MKKLTFILMFISISVFAQKAEMDKANAAFEQNNFKEVIKNADEALKLLRDNNTVEPEDIEIFLFNAGQAAQKLNNMHKAAGYYALLNRVETKPYFQMKNKDTRDWEYYFYQSLAERKSKEGNYSKIKRKKLSPKYINKVLPELTKMAEDDLKMAKEAAQKKDFETAHKKFLSTYDLSKALGNENKIYLYYAALFGLQTKKLKKDATNRLKFLASRNFDGVQTTYSATNLVSGKITTFNSKKEMDNQVQLGLCIDPKIEKSKSLEEEMYYYLVYGCYETGQYDDGIAAAKKALEKFPNNEKISQLLSSMYYKSGRIDEFVSELQEKVNGGTASAVDYFNLAKMLDDDPKIDKETIYKYYETAIEKDPSMVNAYINLSLSIIKPEKKYVDLMNANMGSSPKEKKIYEENAKKRKKLYERALPYLEKAYSLDTNNTGLIKVLETTYDILGNDEKFFEMKEKLKNM